MNTLIDTKTIGAITEMQCMLEFKKQNFTVLMSHWENTRYDFVVDINNKFIKIQVKTARLTDNDGSIEISTRMGGDKYYQEGDIDYFATFYNNQCYLIPANQCHRSKKLRIKNSRNNQKTNINFIQEFEFMKVLKDDGYID